VRTGLTPQEELQVRRLRFDQEIERDYRSEAAESGRLRLRGVFGVGYLVIAAFVLQKIATQHLHPTWDYLVLSLGLPFLPLLAASSRLLARYVMHLTAFGWLCSVGTLVWLVGSPKSTLLDFTDRALIQVIVASCAVVLVRMPAYLVAFCGYGLFAAYFWSVRRVDALHSVQDHDFREFQYGLIKISIQLFAAITVFVVGSYFTETIERRSFLTRRLLAEERRKTQKLIANMLPPAITERLLERPDVIAEMHPNVTVMFADIVDFTPFAATHPAEEVVGRLNAIFSRFDQIVEAAGVEKIKTIGDAYMVAAGLPEFRPDHLEAILDVSLEMLRVAEEMDVQLRVGVQSGPVMAGVIGTKKYLYDLWGDTVNAASRMESHGLPGTIQITETIALKVETHYALQERGTIQVKGLGHVRTFYVKGKKSID
jgi:class 3 adenylate cyclase